MKHPKVVLVLMLSVLILLALNAGGCDIGEPPVYRNNSSPIYVGLNDEFVIALEANHTTGYSWRLAEEVDEEKVSLQSVEYEAGDTEVLGAPGEEKWTFKAEGEGRTELKFEYVRPWESAGAAEESESGTQAAAAGNETAAATTAEAHATDTETATATAAEAEGVTAPEEEAASGEAVTYIVDVGPKGSAAKKPTEYTYEDGKIKEEEKEVPEAEVELGAQLALIVPSNPTTGYVWRLAEPLDGNLLVLVSTESEIGAEEKEKEEGEETPVGMGYDEVWTFRAIGLNGDEETETVIKLEKIRPWEENVDPVDTLTLPVKIKPPEDKEE